MYQHRNIKILELAANVVQLHLRAPILPALSNAFDVIDNTTALGWINHGSVANDGAIVAFLT